MISLNSITRMVDICVIEGGSHLQGNIHLIIKKHTIIGTIKHALDEFSRLSNSTLQLRFESICISLKGSKHYTVTRL
jgi:hypothetical protein